MRAIAGGLGFTYDQSFRDMDPEDLKREIKTELMQQIEYLTPHEVNDQIANDSKKKTRDCR